MERSESEIIKDLAINGKFKEIAEQFGTKRVSKAEIYVQAKLDSLRTKTAEGISLAGISYATPFMMYAVVQEGNQIVDMAKGFVEQENKDESDLELVSQPSSQLRKTPTQSSEAVEEDGVTPPKEATSISVVTPVRPAKSFQAPAVRAPKNPVKKSKKTEKVGKERASRKMEKTYSKKEKQPKSEKQRKYPDAPKKAKAAYMFYLAHIRTVLLQENGTMGITDIAKEPGVRWKTLSDDEKEPFVAQAAEDKARYTMEVEKYKKKHPDYSATKKRKDSNTSKKQKQKKKARHTKEKDRDSGDEGNMEEEAEEDGGGDGGGGGASQFESTQRQAAKAASTGIARAVYTEIVHEPSVPTGTKKRTKLCNKHSAHTIPYDSGGSLAIKQEDLDSQEDLLHSNLKAYDNCAYPGPLVFTKGLAVSLALEPYRTFLADLPQDSIDPSVLQDIQRVCALQQSILQATVKACEPLIVGPSAQEQYTLLTLSGSGAQRGQYKILYADLASPLLTSDTFLIETAKLRASVEAPWLFVNAQVRRLFATADPAVAEWQEGSVYYIREDIKENPYGAVHVVWLQQEQDTNHWLYSFSQTDIECSPWDLEPSTYVLPEKVSPPSIPRSLLVGTLDPALILEYIKTLDGSRLFLADMTHCMDPEYCDIFPDPEERLCLPTLARLCRQGRYSDLESSNSPQSHLGILALFADLQRMIAQSKAFNASNRAFLPWRLAEMLEKAVLHLKSVLADRRGISCLQSSLREDSEAEREQLQLSQAV